MLALDQSCHLQENNIGQDFALYYLAYAAYMELRGNFAKADAIFQDGLARCSMQPNLHEHALAVSFAD